MCNWDFADQKFKRRVQWGIFIFTGNDVIAVSLTAQWHSTRVSQGTRKGLAAELPIFPFTALLLFMFCQTRNSIGYRQCRFDTAVRQWGRRTKWWWEGVRSNGDQVGARIRMSELIAGKTKVTRCYVTAAAAGVICINNNLCLNFDPLTPSHWVRRKEAHLL